MKTNTKYVKFGGVLYMITSNKTVYQCFDNGKINHNLVPVGKDGVLYYSILMKATI